MQTIVIPTHAKPAAIERVARVLHSLAPGVPWQIQISEYKPRRSEQQNRYLWGYVYPELCKHLDGFEPDDVHEYMLGECFGWETLEGFGKKRLRPLKRSSRLNKQEFSDYLAFIQRRAAEHGVYIADADERAA